MIIQQARFVEDTGAKQGIEWLVARSHLSRTSNYSIAVKLSCTNSATKEDPMETGHDSTTLEEIRPPI
jgi:hypothetical protein